VLFVFLVFELEIELELIQTHMTQKPVLRVEVSAVSCSSVLLLFDVWLCIYLPFSVLMWRASRGRQCDVLVVGLFVVGCWS
jgi:hypothetical protein